MTGAIALLLASATACSKDGGEQTGSTATPAPEPVATGTAPTASPTAGQTGSGREYLADQVKVGDKLGQWTVEKREEGTYGVGSIKHVLSGKVELKGSFEWYNEMAVYNTGEIIFQPDEASAALLPAPKGLQSAAASVVLDLADPAWNRQFGGMRWTGTVSLVLDRYEPVAADILEGVPYRVRVAELRAVEAKPPLPPEQDHPDFAADVKPFPQLKPAAKLDEEAGRAVLKWLEEVSLTFSQGINMREKPISEAQRGTLREWLQTTFTASLAGKMLDASVPPSEEKGLYWMAGGLSGLGPIGSADKIDQIEWQMEGDKTILKARHVLSGTQDAYMTYTLKDVSGHWLIEDVNEQRR